MKAYAEELFAAGYVGCRFVIEAAVK